MQVLVAIGVLLLCLYVKLANGQSVKFFDMNMTQTVSRCTNGTYVGDKKIVLSGEAHLPKNPNLTSYIFFDMRSEVSQYNQLCFVDTSNSCHDSSVVDNCYCKATDVPDTYRFYLDITAESRLGRRQITGFLLFRNSSKVITETTLNDGLDSTLNPMPDVTINGKAVEKECDMVMQGDSFELQANCHSSSDRCWLHLQLSDSAESVVNSTSVSYKKTYTEGGQVILTLSRSICDENQFEKVLGCNITFVSEARIHESGLSNEILGIIIGCSVGFAISGIVIVISVLICRRKSAKKKPLITKVDMDQEQDAEEKQTMLNQNNGERKKEHVVFNHVYDGDHTSADTSERDIIKPVVEKSKLYEEVDETNNGVENGIQEVDRKPKEIMDEGTHMSEPEDDEESDMTDEDEEDEERDENSDNDDSGSDDEMVLSTDIPMKQIKELLRMKGFSKRTIKKFDEVCKEIKSKQL